MRKAQPFNLILLGDPAAGKATQAKLLARRYGLYDFDMGHELRRVARGTGAAARRLATTLASGRITPTVIARRVLLKTLHRIPQFQGILFDGHPKMVGEARLLARELAREGRRDPFVIYLSLPRAEVKKRAKRRGRPEDAPHALARRRAYYRRHIRPALAFYRHRYGVTKISGLGTRVAVLRRLIRAIKANI